MYYSCNEVGALSFCICNVFHYSLLFLKISYYFTFMRKSQAKFFFIKFTITNILILLLWNFKSQLIIQFQCPLMIKVIAKILFAVLLASLFLPKDKCRMHETFLSKVSIKSSGNVTCVVDLLILLMILNKLSKTNKFYQC